MNKPEQYYYKPPGSRCLICGAKVNAIASLKGWSWWMRSSDRRIIGLIHDACYSPPPDKSDKKIRPWSRV